MLDLGGKLPCPTCGCLTFEQAKPTEPIKPTPQTRDEAVRYRSGRKGIIRDDRLCRDCLACSGLDIIDLERAVGYCLMWSQHPDGRERVRGDERAAWLAARWIEDGGDESMTSEAFERALRLFFAPEHAGVKCFAKAECANAGAAKGA